jgi:hypothetical protein
VEFFWWRQQRKGIRFDDTSPEEKSGRDLNFDSSEWKVKDLMGDGVATVIHLGQHRTIVQGSEKVRRKPAAARVPKRNVKPSGIVDSMRKASG